jgi:predicted AlkP superfamily phosphohydrolase/phosphomutase
VQGREPKGIVSAAEYDLFLTRITEKLASLRHAHGRPLGARVFRPSESYRQTRNVSPDLIVQLGEGRWTSVASIGHPSPFLGDLTEVATPSGPGIFVLTSPNCPLAGEFEGAHLFDLAPTLLDLAGYQVPASMQGRSLVAGMEKKGGGPSPESEQIILDRLAGLGYV